MRLRRSLFWLASFASIATLLIHLYAWASMAQVAVILWPAAGLILAGTWLWSRAVGDEDFRRRVRMGFIGGLWGTLGYDFVRVPIHLMGQNPFFPIRGYGVWILGAQNSSPLTDLAGLLYHASNGITFGWIYSFILIGRHWGWALLWGLLLETLAIVSPFGDVFQIRGNYSALSIAYAAHLFYGYPLGIACARSTTHISPHTSWFTVLLIAIFVGWFMTAWQPIRNSFQTPPGTIQIGPGAIYPGWTEIPMGGHVQIINRLPESISLRWRKTKGAERTLTIGASQVLDLPMKERGLFQFGIPGGPWRSVLVAVHERGDYRP